MKRRVVTALFALCGMLAESAEPAPAAELYLKAAKLLIEDGKAKEAEFPWKSDGYRDITSDNIDKVAYDGRKPNAYIDSLKIGLKGREKVEGASVVGG